MPNTSVKPGQHECSIFVRNSKAGTSGWGLSHWTTTYGATASEFVSHKSLRQEILCSFGGDKQSQTTDMTQVGFKREIISEIKWYRDQNFNNPQILTSTRSKEPLRCCWGEAKNSAGMVIILSRIGERNKKISSLGSHRSWGRCRHRRRRRRRRRRRLSWGPSESSKRCHRSKK